MTINRRSLLAASLAVPAAALAACSSASTATGAATEADASTQAEGSAGLPNLEPDPTADIFAAQRIVPVLRNPTADGALATARAWLAAGATCIELTTTTPDVFEAAEALVADGAYVGIGTMRSSDHVRSAAQAGARYVLSFATFPGLIDTAFELGITPVPGTMTPTEVYASLRAPLIKVFPAATVGIDYLQALQIVYPGLRTQVTGGIGATPDDARAWLAAGATAVGIPGDACGTAESDGAEAVTASARRFLEAVQGRG